MKINLRTGEMILAVITLISLAISVLFFWILPAQIVTSFSTNGWAVSIGWFNQKLMWTESEPPWLIGYNSKFFGTFAFSIILGVIMTFYLIYPRFKKRPFDIRYKYYDRFIILLFISFLSFQIFIIYWNLVFRWQPDLGKILSIFIGAFLFLIGDIIEHSEPGWFLSWPSKWLKNEIVWQKTRRIGGFCIKIGGILFAISLFFKLGLIGSILSLPLFFGFYYIIAYPILANRKLKRTDEKRLV